MGRAGAGSPQCGCRPGNGEREFASDVCRVGGVSPRPRPKRSGPLFPAGQLPTLYDFHFDPNQKKWVPWNALVPEYAHSREKKFIDILGEWGPSPRSLGRECAALIPWGRGGDRGLSGARGPTLPAAGGQEGETRAQPRCRLGVGGRNRRLRPGVLRPPLPCERCAAAAGSLGATLRRTPPTPRLLRSQRGRRPPTARVRRCSWTVRFSGSSQSHKLPVLERARPKFKALFSLQGRLLGGGRSLQTRQWREQQGSPVFSVRSASRGQVQGQGRAWLGCAWAAALVPRPEG